MAQVLFIAMLAGGLREDKGEGGLGYPIPMLRRPMARSFLRIGIASL